MGQPETTEVGVSTTPHVHDQGTEKESEVSIKSTEAPKDEYQYVTGFKFTIVMIAITLICFLVILDISIVVTVSHRSPRPSANKKGHSADYYCFPFIARCWLVW
jgi:hypothetical protein